MLYGFELGRSAVEATKNICYAKDKGTVIKWFCSDCKNLDDLAVSGKPKSEDSETML